MADPCATERRERDRADVALQRNQRTIDNATAGLAAAAATAHHADPALPEECLTWIGNAASGLSSEELNRFPPPCLTHVHGPCSSVWRWAGKRARAEEQRPALQQVATERRAALVACLAQHDDAAPDAGAPAVPPATDEQADDWLDHPQPSDEDLDGLPPAGTTAPPGGGGGSDDGTGGGGGAGGSDGRCGAARVGHGHEGEACQVRLGEDGWCQYHGAVA